MRTVEVGLMERSKMLEQLLASCWDLGFRADDQGQGKGKEWQEGRRKGEARTEICPSHVEQLRPTGLTTVTMRRGAPDHHARSPYERAFGNAHLTCSLSDARLILTLNSPR